jgi:type VI protein secretion system component VasK
MHTYGGAWDVFRMIDATRIGSADPQRVVLNIKDTFHHAHVTIEPATASTNPFASSWRGFRCGS